jgi:hypothetical protein
VPDGSRSRFIFHDLIFPGIVSAGISEPDALALSIAIKGAVLKSAKATASAADQKPDENESQEERREDEMYGFEVGAARACATTALGELPSANRCTLEELANAAANAVLVDRGSFVRPSEAMA